MIRSERAHLQIAADSHPGMTGKNNEDRYAVSAYRLSSSDRTPSVLAVLCDGIGGHRAGEVAAELAVNAISQTVAESNGRQPVKVLREAIVSASAQVYAFAQSDSDHFGMGATCACAWVIGNQLYAATVGDSRIYLVRNQAIQQLSTDHTWIQEALESGALQPSEVQGHPNAHVIRRFLGSPSEPKVDFRLRILGSESTTQAEANQGMRLLPGDQLLLCSDGLTDLVSGAEILAALRDDLPQLAVQKLIDLANARGGHDNITIIILAVPARTPVLGGLPIHIRWPWVVLGCAVLVALALALGFGLMSLGILTLGRSPTGTPAATPTLPPILQTVLPGSGPGLPTLIPVGPTPTPSIPVFPTMPGSGARTATPWPTLTARPATAAPLPTQAPLPD